MVRPTITEDYYRILKVPPSATLDLISQSYKKLALKLHPDRNLNQNTTAEFQLLGEAYETLKDEDKRREYDLIYPSISGTRGATRATPSQSAHTSRAQQEASDEAQIATLLKSKQERADRLNAKKRVLEPSIFELQRSIRQLQNQIASLDSIRAAELAEDAYRKSWTAWVLSPLYKKAEENEEEKSRKARARQERMIEKDMKERRLMIAEESMKEEKGKLQKAIDEVVAPDRRDDQKIQMIRERIAAVKAREARERAEKAQKEWMDRRAKEEEMRRKEMMERMEKERAERERIEKARREENERLQRERAAEQRRRTAEFVNQYEDNNRYTSTAACIHDGWWPKVQGRTARTACPRCGELWTYLLQCPECNMKACPRCQAAVRPRRRRQRQRSPSPTFMDWYD